MKKRVGFIVLAVILAAGIFNIVYGFSSYKTQFNTRYGTTGTAIDQCILCHATNRAPQIPSIEIPANPYGVALETNGLNFAAIESLDSDGDGFNNITEINARTFPGNSASRPATTDTTPPTVSAFSVPTASTSLTVSITTFTATDNVGVTGYMITESATAPAATATGWTATAPTNYTASAAGARTLYAWAKDAANNVSTSRTASVTITLPPNADTTPPAITAFIIPATSSSLTVPITTFTATDNLGVTGYMIKESEIAPLASEAGWSATAPTSYTASAAGYKYLFAWAKDAAGNVSFSTYALVNINLASTADTTRPTITAFSISGTSSSLTVPITTFTATDNVGVTGYMITESATAPAATAAGWSATAPTSYAASAAGYKYLFAWAKDAAGNVSFYSYGLVNISLASTADTIRPTVTAFTIPATSSSLTVPITTFTATDNVGVTGYMVTESGTAPAATAAGWSATAPTSYAASAAGYKYLFAWAKDAAGNVSFYSYGLVNINLAVSSTADATRPTITAFTIPATSPSLNVPITTFTATDNVGVTGYMITESGTAPTATATGWTANAPTNYRASGSGYKYLFAWAKDAAGNVSLTRYALVNISLATSTADATPPTITAFNIPGTSSSLTVPITTFTATDNVGVTGYMVTESTTVPVATAAGWKSTAPTRYRVSAAGNKYLYAWVKDAAGNVSASKAALVWISLPTSTPSLTSPITPGPAIPGTRSNIRR